MTTQRIIIKDKEKHIIATFYIDEGSDLSYRTNFSIEGTHIINVDILQKGYYVGTIECWKGYIETTLFVINKEGKLLEKSEGRRGENDKL